MHVHRNDIVIAINDDTVFPCGTLRIFGVFARRAPLNKRAKPLCDLIGHVHNLDIGTTRVYQLYQTLPLLVKGLAPGLSTTSVNNFFDIKSLTLNMQFLLFCTIILLASPVKICNHVLTIISMGELKRAPH